MLSELIEAKGEAMFRHACRMGLEGIVSKRLSSPDVSGGRGTGLRRKTRVSREQAKLAFLRTCEELEQNGHNRKAAGRNVGGRQTADEVFL